MAISGIQTINIGIQNESVGSDSLYVAFNKAANNFSNLFACASPYNTFTGNGVSINANSSTGTLDFTNTGVTSLNAGTGIVLSSSNGNVTISSTGGGGGNGGGTVTSVGVSSSTLNVGTTSLGNIVSAGNIIVNLSNISGVSGTYVYPTVSVDQYGRITSIASASSVGTVTSVAISGGTGIQVANSPITSSGTIQITNTGVTRITAGSGITVSGSNAEVTVSAAPVAAVTSVALTSSTLNVSGSPITSAGIITVDLPATITGNVTAGNLVTSGVVTATGNITGGNVKTSGILSSTGNVTAGGMNVGSGNISVGNIYPTGQVSWGMASPNISTAGGGYSLELCSQGAGWSELNYAGKNMVYVDSTGAGIEANATGTTKYWYFLNSGDAQFPGNLSVKSGVTSNNATSGIGYSTGAGLAVTQGTSRTTGVTINAVSGAITLFSAAGTSAYTTFTVTNSTVAATDVIIVNQKSGTDKYEAFVTNVAAGSFNITFSDVSGTTTEQPVFNFAVIKAVAA